MEGSNDGINDQMSVIGIAGWGIPRMTPATRMAPPPRLNQRLSVHDRYHWVGGISTIKSEASMEDSPDGINGQVSVTVIAKFY